MFLVPTRLAGVKIWGAPRLHPAGSHCFCTVMIQWHVQCGCSIDRIHKRRTINCDLSCAAGGSENWSHLRDNDGSVGRKSCRWVKWGEKGERVLFWGLKCHPLFMCWDEDTHLAVWCVWVRSWSLDNEAVAPHRGGGILKTLNGKGRTGYGRWGKLSMFVWC